MKKLLALILCVMMFVAVIPTTAFAAVAYPTAGQAYTNGAYATQAIKDAVTNANDAIKLMQGTVVANETVFGTIKTVDDLFVSMAKNIFADYAPYDSNDPAKSTMEGNVKAALRTFVGAVINGEMKKDTTVAYYTNDKGIVQPDKFLTKYISAFNKATNSAEAQKYIEAVLTTAMANAMIPAVEEKMSNLKDSIADWEDGTSIWNNTTTGYGFADSTPNALIDSFGSWLAPKADNQILIGPQGIID